MEWKKSQEWKKSHRIGHVQSIQASNSQPHFICKLRDGLCVWPKEVIKKVEYYIKDKN